MALRIRKDGRILCAALHPPKDGDTYIDDGLHYEMSVIHRVIYTDPEPIHSQHGEWWWSGRKHVDHRAEGTAAMSDEDIELPPLPKASKMYDIPGYDEEELKDYARTAILADRARRELLAERDELAKDAARYRWLRKGESDDVAVVRGLGATDYGMSAVVYTYSEDIDGDDLDAAIDAAMKKEGRGYE